ncbi:MAG: YhgE/Pip family protein [Micropruina glycogenica]
MRQLWNLTLTELRRFRGPLPMLSAIFLVLVPLLYGAIYLWSNWDPYGRLDRLQVAVVDLDKPVTVEGKKVSGGADLVEQLTKDTSSFTWVVTDATTAADGVADGSFAFSITVPKDFSADLTSIATSTRRRAPASMWPSTTPRATSSASWPRPPRRSCRTS